MEAGFSDGVKEGYEYTYSGQVSRTVNGNGNAIQYRYNSFGKVRERIDQLGYAETFQYDEEGNLMLHTDRDDRQVQRTYNVFGDPVYEKAAGAEGKEPCISTWRYDSLGRLVRAVCDGHSYEYIYDRYGNLKEKRSNGKRLVSYAYDRAGKIKEIKDPAGVSTCYEYDILGRVSRIHSAGGMEVSYGYDSLDRLESIYYGNGVQTSYSYDCDGNISHLETKTESAVLLSFIYQYDGNGNRTAKTGTQGLTAGSSALDISYRYDVRGQLLEERRNNMSTHYAYDAAGNRIRKTEGEKKTRYHYNAKNQLLSAEQSDGIKNFAYDRQGGIVEEKGQAGTRRFIYNSRHQQTRVETETGNIQENRYDAEGLRYELLENGRRTSFVYHNGELLHEKGGETGLSREETSYHLGAGIEAFQRNNVIYYYHQNEQLSTALISDGNGDLKNQYQYDAFGIGLDALEELLNRIRYTGQQYDQQTEQYYLRARYYNPVLGRFMQEDAYQGDGLNLYAYCGNNPVVYCDPSGYGGVKMKGGGCPPQSLVNDSDIDNYRQLLNNPDNPKTKQLLETVAVGRTDIKGLEDSTFYGASPQVVQRAHEKNVPKTVIDYIDSDYPDRKVKSPYDYENVTGHQQFAPHAEEMLIADFEAKVKVAGYTDYNEVKGNLFMIQSNPTGVCNKCTVGLWNTNKDGKSGIFKRFMTEFPNVNVYVTTYGGGKGGYKGHSVYSFNIVDGKVYDVKRPE